MNTTVNKKIHLFLLDGLHKNYTTVGQLRHFYNLKGIPYGCNDKQAALRDSDSLKIALKIYPNTSLFKKLYPNGKVKGNFLEVELD